jgi:hypothetical protein
MPVPDYMGNDSIDLKTRLTRFAVGLLIVAGMACFFASGYTPPGICGEVLRHNQQADIDASPFFYGDVENMLEIIESAEQWTANAPVSAQ